ncbi:MAG: hypothetical protein R3C59_23845 [Planctomycetaceae bacterium]
MSDVIPWKWRPDLQARPHEGGGWIVNDPLNSEYTFLNDHEYFAAIRLDGSTAATEWCHQLQLQFPDFRISTQQLTSFLQRLIQQQLVLGTTWGASQPVLQQRQRSQSRSWLSRLSGLFSIQIPLVDPTSFLTWIQPWTSLLFTRLFAAIVGLLWIVASGLMIVHFREFTQSLPDLSTLITRHSLPVVFLVFCVIKGLHEFGHAVACHHYSARCRSCGVMFLILTPVLFTDVSDSWSLPRRQRMSVTAAGIVVELTIAALCMLAWTVVADGFLKVLLTSTILLCTATTVLFNANPLLRFDGYFLLADFVAIPNLYQQASERTGQLARRILFGIRSQVADSFQKARLLITVYGLAAAVYRIFVAVAIVRLVLAVAADIEQQSLGSILAVLVFLSFLAIPFAMFLKNTWALSQNTGQRLLTGLRLVLLFAALMLVLRFEYPYRVTAPCVLVPDGEAVYVTEPGELRSAAAYGTLLQPTDKVAQLSDVNTQVAVRRLQAELSQQTILLDELRRMPADSAPRDLATAAEAVHALEAQLEALHGKVSKLDVVTTVAGTLLPPPPVPPSATGAELATWSGLPLDPDNRNALLERGTLLGFVGRPLTVKVLAFVDESEAAYVKRGVSADVFLSNGSRQQLRTTVVDMAAIDDHQIPPQLVSRGLLERQSSHSAMFRSTLIADDSAVEFRPSYYAVGMVRISGRNVSVGQRLTGALRRNFPAFFGR